MSEFNPATIHTDQLTTALKAMELVHEAAALEEQAKEIQKKYWQPDETERILAGPLGFVMYAIKNKYLDIRRYRTIERAKATEALVASMIDHMEVVDLENVFAQ